MNREIKFRMWDKQGNYMSIYSLQQFANHDYFGNPNMYEVMQFTGLTDKNGKEIYEGDIINCKGQNWKVKLHEKWGWLGVPEDELKYIHAWYDGVEVIGNIYENPELLK